MKPDSQTVERAKRAAQASIKAKRARGADYHNPATSNRSYTRQELEFLKAVEEFKKKTGKRFLTETDRFAVLISLGYVKMGISA